MSTHTNLPVRDFRSRILRLTLSISILSTAIPTPPVGAAPQDPPHVHNGAQTAPAKLVQIVRDSTKQFINVNAATAAGYQPFLGCVSGPDHGAMGFHYANGALVGDGLLDATRPEV